MSSPSSPVEDGVPPPDTALVEYALHVGHPPVTAEVAAACEQLLAEMNKEEAVQKNKEVADMFLTQQNLHRYLRARNFDVSKARKLMVDSFTWRASYRPDRIRASEVEAECATGKIRVLPQRDRHGRPIIVMDSSRENSKGHESQVRHLVWQLERATRKMNPPTTDGQPTAAPFVEKYVVFIQMARHSIWNAPPLKTSMETLKCLTERFPEHLGHAIVYQPGMLFSGLWSACKPLMDPKTVRKVLFVRGDVSDGSKNDKLLREVIGDQWREWCDVPKDDYDHKTFWAQVLADEAEWDQRQAKAEEAKASAQQQEQLQASAQEQTPAQPEPATQ